MRTGSDGCRFNKKALIPCLFTQGTRACSRGSTLIWSHCDCNVINVRAPGRYSAAFLQVRFQPIGELSLARCKTAYCSLHGTLKICFYLLYPKTGQCQPFLPRFLFDLSNAYLCDFKIHWNSRPVVLYISNHRSWPAQTHLLLSDQASWSPAIRQ